MTQPALAITGMSVITPIGDTPEAFLRNLLEGRSGLTAWKRPEFGSIPSKVGGDLSDYDVDGRFSRVAGSLPGEVAQRLRRFVRRSPWSTKLSALMAAAAFLDAGLFDDPIPADEIATIIAGHNLNLQYIHANHQDFADHHDHIDPRYALHSLDTDHAGVVSELLGCRGPALTVGAACASGNMALRQACCEIRQHSVSAAVVVGAVFDFSPVELHGMALMGAITADTFADCPEVASRPFDVRRDGFVPSHAGAVLVVEPLSQALRRGAHVHAEVLDVAAGSGANHLPEPDEESQVRLMKGLLDATGVDASEVDYINAHATSTPLGDLTEARAIDRVFGPRAPRVNATKSLIGHPCWSSALVETVAAIMQMNAGVLHPTAHIDALDPAIGLDVCSAGPVRQDVNLLMKNSFGFGGINCISLLRKFQG
jgi:3-oxoacyl-(acyl-carrier-protein) synthase